MKTITDKSRIEEIFKRGTLVEALPSKDALLERLMSGEPLKIYYGMDPTATSIHLGHAKNIIFLEELRQLGHEVTLLIGDFTAQIGDPSDKSATRKQLTAEDVKNNVAGWMDQIKPLLSFEDKENPAKVVYNHDWLSKLTMAEVVTLSANFTVQQMLERDMFQKRMKDNTPIHLHEFLYPLMQGYDSVALDTDAELCGTDQIFNALAGRTLLKRLKNKEKFVIALNLIANPKTGELMSKSNGTGVFVGVPANDLFGAIMALPDPMIEPLYVNCTRLPMDDFPALMAEGPRQAKVTVARDIVRRFHGEVVAQGAVEAFEKTFSKGGVPEDIQEIKMTKEDSLAETLVKAGIIASKAEWRRLIDGGGVRLENDEKVTDPNFKLTATTILKVGKRRFVKIVV